ncbi:hypothetical protein HELRODRAFT_167299 [Helobdella robusta]|uniref:Uncharacterized protein n=1 Tax=Helobdella robusta TaxID=6412 RepID=T1EZ85_HELRO|nr:hypothetical protein HELRODRAFT_167299 [Helobdella robusta]ESO10800.1 hypothetical protein HELRODRAFT_167299 [Helobdella robusta]
MPFKCFQRIALIVCFVAVMFILILYRVAIESNCRQVTSDARILFTKPLKEANEVKVVSMSLYGSQPRYVGGALKNAELVKKNFPGWTLRVYVDSSNSSKYEAVPSNVLKELEGLGVDVHRVENDELSVPPMMWRFLVADDPTVDRFIIRDSDSRLTERDYKGVQVWMASRQAFHCVRDHPSHAMYAISGGLWGARSKILREILNVSWLRETQNASSSYMSDMDFLNEKIWPRVSKHAFCTDSVSCGRYPNSFPFTEPRKNFEHIGQAS